MAEPDYPEYEQLMQVVRAQSPFVNPTEIAEHQEVIRRRGLTWCAAVLGRSVASLRDMSMSEARLLGAADVADISPDLPVHIHQERARALAQRAALDAEHERLRMRDDQRWEQVRQQCSIPIEVRANTAGRRYGTGLDAGPLRHVVALVPAHSGTRVHLVGRPLCESPNRWKPRSLSGPTTEPATCISCLKFATTAKETR